METSEMRQLPPARERKERVLGPPLLSMGTASSTVSCEGGKAPTLNYKQRKEQEGGENLSSAKRDEHIAGHSCFLRIKTNLDFHIFN